MQSGEVHEPSGADELQFDRAEYPAAPPETPTCRICQKPITDVYFHVNEAVLCGGCRGSLESHYRRGAGFFGFLKAVAQGFPAALAGAVITYLAKVLAGIPAGIVSILVGYMVGKSVRKGSGDRGGLPYQLLAVFLTYSAVSWSYVPILYKQLHEQAVAHRQQAGAAGAGVAVGKAENKNVVGRKPATAPGPAVDAGGAPADRLKASVLWVAMMVLIIGLSYAVPFWLLSQGQGFLTLLIIFFGLSQAWRLNRKVVLAIGGPFRVGVGEGGPAFGGDAAHG